MHEEYRIDFTGTAGTVVQVASNQGNIFVGKAKRSAEIPRQLPMRTSSFVDRSQYLEMLDQVIDNLPSEPNALFATVPLITITGSPGVGKSSLAIHWAHRSRKHFPDGDLYIDMQGYGAGTPLTAEDALARFLDALNVPFEDLPEGTEKRAALYRTLVAGRTMLIVIDNAANVADVRPLLPASERCAVLITSRDRLSGLAVREGAKPLSLDTLPPDEAAGLLKLLIGSGRQEAEPESLRTLASLCGHLPIALRVLGERASRYPTTPLHTFVTELREERNRLDILHHEDAFADTRSIFSWSYKRLSDEAKRAFRIASLHPSTEFDLTAMSAMLGRPTRTTENLLQELTSSHLLQEPELRHFKYHGLLHAYASERAMTEETPEARAAATQRLLNWHEHAVHSACTSGFPDFPAVPPVSARADLSVPDFSGKADALRWMDREYRGMLSLLQQAMELESYGHAWRISSNAYPFLELLSHWPEWVELSSIGVAAAQAAADAFGEARNLLALADANWRIGDYAASAEQYQRALSLAQEIEDPWVEGFALRGIGLTHEEQGDLDAAAPYFEGSLRVFSTHGRQRGVAMSLLSLSRCAIAAGSLETAVAKSEEASAIFAGLQDDWSTAWGALTFGRALSQSGRAADAEARLRRAVEVFAECADYRSEAMAWNELGEVYHRAKDLPQALKAWDRSAQLFEALQDEQAASVRARMSAAKAETGDGKPPTE